MRRCVDNELGKLVKYIFEETGKAPLYIDSEVVMYRRSRDIDKVLAKCGGFRNVVVTYGKNVIVFELWGR